MKHSNDTGSSAQKRQDLLTLCRFLAVRFVYRTMLVLPVVSGIFLAFAGRTQFAPFGIALVCLILPLFLNDAVTNSVKKENNESSLSSLYQRYRYSSVLFLSYRITLTLPEQVYLSNSRQLPHLTNHFRSQPVKDRPQIFFGIFDLTGVHPGKFHQIVQRDVLFSCTQRP